MDDISLLEQIIALHKKDKVAFDNATGQFKQKNYAEVFRYVKDKSVDTALANEATNRSFDLFIELITMYRFDTKNYIKSLKSLAILPNYQRLLANELIEYLNHNSLSKYISTEKKIRQKIVPIFKTLTFFFFSGDTENGTFKLRDTVWSNDSSQLNEEEITFDWICKMAFEVYIHQVLGNYSPISANKLNKMVMETCQVFIIKFSVNENLVEKITVNINKIFKVEFANTTRSNNLPVEDLHEVYNDSFKKFLDKVKSLDLFIKTSLTQFWAGIFYKTEQEYRRKRKKEIEQKDDSLFSKVNYPEQMFDKKEVWKFLSDGLNAIKDVHNGNARGLLVVGRKTLFIKLIQDSLLYFRQKDIKPSESYKNKTSEAQQRADCKKELIKWMKAQINNPESIAYGEKGIRMIEFICSKKLSEL